MNLNLRFFAFMSIFLLCSFFAYGRFADTVDGINYDYNSTGVTVTGLHNSYKDSTEITIPSVVTIKGTNYYVTEIAEEAFYMNEILKTVTFGGTAPITKSTNSTKAINRPQLVIPFDNLVIGDWAFYRCINLKTINIYSGGIKTIGAYAFSNTNLSEVTIPSSVTKISQGAFASTSMMNIHCSNNQNYMDIDGILFSIDGGTLVQYPGGRTGKYSVPTHVHTLGIDAFDNSQLSEINMPNSVINIETGVFDGCTNLRYLILPESVKSIGYLNFYRCSLFPLIISSTSKIDFADNSVQLTSGYIITRRVNYNEVKKQYSGKVLILEDMAPVELKETGKTSFSVSFKLQEGIWASLLTSNGTTFEYTVYGNKKLIQPNSEGIYTVNCDEPGDVEISINWVTNTGQRGNILHTLSTNKINIYTWKDFETTETSITDQGILVSSYPEKPERITVEVDGVVKDYPVDWFAHQTGNWSGQDYNDDEIDPPTLAFDHLLPGTDYDVFVTAYFNAGKYSKNFKVRTKNSSSYIQSTATQTTVTINDIVLSEEMKSVAEKIEVSTDGQKFVTFKGSPITFRGLYPDQYITIYARITYGKSEHIFSSSFRTVNLNLQIVNESVTPTTISLSGVWRDGDAEVTRCWFSRYPDGKHIEETGLTPNYKYKYTFNVEVSGRTYSKTTEFTTPKIKLTTLQPRPVSEKCAIVAAETNLSDNETNVGFQWRKYDAPASLVSNEGFAAIYDGMVEGYIRNLQPTSYYNVRAFYKDRNGTYIFGEWVTFDPSDFSFFEPTVHTYPVLNASTNTATIKGYALAGSEPIISQGIQYWKQPQSRSYDNMKTVEVTGQVMNIVLENLEPGTTYGFRAFVQTSSGYTYGEEQSFETATITAIDNIAEDKEVYIIGYYDLTGKRYESPQNGFNIILYSDGTTKKVLIK